MKSIKYIIALVCAGLSMNLSAQQQSPKPEKEQSTREERNEIRAGNRHFEAEEYDLAEKQYRKALDINPNSEVASYNLATTLYKKEKWEDARKEYTNLLRTQNRERRARVYHNLGNISFKEKNFAQSIEEYKNSLRLNPKDDETRYNLRVAQLLLEEQQRNQQDQQQDQQNQPQEQEQEQKEQEQQQDQNKPQEQEQKEDEQQQQQPAQPQPEEMTRENAEQILRAIQQDERETQEKVEKQRMQQQKRRKTDKEW